MLKIYSILLFVGPLLTAPLSFANALPQTLDTLSLQEQKLVQQAHKTQKQAYAPYSHYQVGSALLTKEGEIFSGANVENASYGLTICAERAAIFNALSAGKKNISTIAVVTKDGGMPCGACRQVMNEFNPNMKVITTNEANTKITSFTLSELMPLGFGPKNLNESS